MDNLWYLAAAYAVVWLGAFAYLASLARTGRNIREEMALLRDLIDGS
jgi:CcmD family protein